MDIVKEEIIISGKQITLNTIKTKNNTYVVTGKFVKVARIKEEWFEDIENPEEILEDLRECKLKIDLLSFIQRLPDTKTKYKYYSEQEKITALPITTYKDWWENQIKTDTRKKAKRAVKRGIEIKVTEFDDELAKGICDIFNEKKVRQGVPFWHYGKTFDTVKAEMSLDLERCDFLGAYYNRELVGIVKLLYAKQIAQPVVIVSKSSFRNKYINNALIAKMVEMCTKKGVTYITYGTWRRGNMAQWLRRNGFENLIVPRYYVPISIKGKLILKTKIHHGFKERLPEKIKLFLIDIRRKWYKKKYNEDEND